MGGCHQQCACQHSKCDSRLPTQRESGTHTRGIAKAVSGRERWKCFRLIVSHLNCILITRNRNKAVKLYLNTNLQSEKLADLIIQNTGWFRTGPPVQYQNEKRPTSQPKALLDEGFHGRAALVISLAFFNFCSEQRGGGADKKITLRDVPSSRVMFETFDRANLLKIYHLGFYGMYSLMCLSLYQSYHLLYLNQRQVSHYTIVSFRTVSSSYEGIDNESKVLYLF